MDNKCNAVKRNGKQCRQHTDLDSDGYCKYHQSPKYKPGLPRPTRLPVSESKLSKPVVTPAVESPDGTECTLCCSEFPSDQSWKLMGFGCCAYKMCRTCAEKVDKCPGCRASTPNLQRSTGRMPSYVTEGDHQVAAELDAQLNSSSVSASAPRRSAPRRFQSEWVDMYNKWLCASQRDKKRAVRNYNLRIDGSPVDFLRLDRALGGRSSSSGGFNVPDLKHIATQLRVPGGPVARGGRQGYCDFIVTKFVSVLG